MPPEVTMKSQFSSVSTLRERMISSASSPHTTVFFTGIDNSLKQYLANSNEFVSRILPLRTSSPMIRHPADLIEEAILLRLRNMFVNDSRMLG